MGEDDKKGRERERKGGREQKCTKEGFVDRFFSLIAIGQEAPQAKCFSTGRKVKMAQV